MKSKTAKKSSSKHGSAAAKKSAAKTPAPKTLKQPQKSLQGKPKAGGSKSIGVKSSNAKSPNAKSAGSKKPTAKTQATSSSSPKVAPKAVTKTPKVSTHLPAVQLSAEITADKRIAIFGGTFNPLHAGHVNVIASVQGRLNLDNVVVIPTAKNPLKPPVEGPTNAQRVDMLKIGLADYPYIIVDEQEIERGGVSYTVDTLRSYAQILPPESLYLIVGLDQFEEFDQWKDVEQILTMANLVVVTRPNHNLPFGEEDLPPGLRPLVAVFDRAFIALTTGRSIEFLRLQDLDISATEVRKRLRTGRNTDRQLSLPVEEYIKTNNLYGPLGPKIGDYETFARFCGQALYSRKAINVRGFDLRKTDAPTEFTVIASGTSTRHATALAENLARAVKDEFNVFPQSIEGTSEGRWVVIDYGSLIVHVFYDFVRQEYRLEDLWRQGRDLEIRDETSVPASKDARPALSKSNH